MKSLFNAQNKKKTTLAIVAVLALIFPLIFRSEFTLYLCCTIELYIVAVSGLDIVFGYCGQISLGHAAFFAIGAYGSAILHQYLGIPILLTMIIAAIFATLIGALLAYPASKLVFHFLSLATVAFGEIVYQLILHSPGGITGDFYGLFSDRLDIFGYELDTFGKYYYFGLICVVVFLTVKHFLVNSKTGRAFTAIRENTHAANGMGVNVRKYKVMAFATSAFFTAYAGAMYMHMVGFVHPDQFLQKQSVLFLTMLLFGGSGSLLGPVVGVVSVEVLIEMIRSLQEYQGFVYGVLLLIVIVALPGGLYGGIKDVYAYIKGKIVKKNDVTAVNGGDRDAES
ncbi:MAG: branched-chain amino acid ABC transporter permease [Oscillospiraceae bacterium]